MSYRRLIDLETASCVYWVVINLLIKLSVFSEVIVKLKPLLRLKNRSQKLQTYFTSVASFQNYGESNTLSITRLKENGLLTNTSQCFRAILSTDSCLAELTDFFLTRKCKRIHAGCTILIGLQRAFDSLDHKIPLKKMSCLGFKTPEMKWLKSYLPNRNLFVSVDDVF